MTDQMDHEAPDRIREIRELDIDECYRLLAGQDLGRLAVNAEHYPLIFPVNYGLDGRVVVIRTAAGTKLAAAQHANVSFEVDEIDRTSRSGWSVLVSGTAELVTPEHDAKLIARTQASDVQPWAPGHHNHWLRLIPHHITGRRIVPQEIPAWFRATGYL